MVGQDIANISSLIRGEAGKPVTLSLQRDGATTPLQISMVRAEIDLPAVSWARIPGTDLVMLRLDRFSSGSADAMKDALTKIMATKPTGIVLDLRGNGGGYINESVNITGDFIKTGVVHISKDADGKITPTPIQPGGLGLDVPLTVLVDGGTASSAEILTGALQDAGRATIIGTKTFGTGTVLSEVSLSDGSALRIGVIEWMTPKGRSIWKVGLTPDQVVPLATGVQPVTPDELDSMSADQVRASKDAQLQKAISDLTTAPSSSASTH